MERSAIRREWSAGQRKKVPVLESGPVSRRWPTFFILQGWAKSKGMVGHGDSVIQ